MAPASMPRSGWYMLRQCPRHLQSQAPSDSSDGALVAIASISLDASSASSPLPCLSSKACLPQLCPKPPQLRSAPATTLPSSVALSGLCISKPCPWSFLDFLVKLQSVVHLGGRLVSSLLCLMSVSFPSQHALHARHCSTPFPILLSPLSLSFPQHPLHVRISGASFAHPRLSCALPLLSC